MLRNQKSKGTVEFKRQSYFQAILADPEKYNSFFLANQGSEDLYDVSQMSHRQMNKFLIQDPKIRAVLDRDIQKANSAQMREMMRRR